MEDVSRSATAILFGPVPSRRLGRSLGINNIPAKHCSYSCVYCQVGRTAEREVDRREFLPAPQVVAAVTEKVALCRARGQTIDFLTFVPDGEPTLDLHLGRELRELAPLGLRRAVISNGSLLWLEDVRRDLTEAELVSVKVDAGDPITWRRVDRPDPRLDFERVRAGMLAFAREYRDELITETMLVAGVNDSEPAVAATGELLERLAPARAYLAVATRPPAEPWVSAPPAGTLARAFAALAERVPRLEWLTAPEEGAFGCIGDPVDDLRAILAVHPMREAAAREYLERAGLGTQALDRLLAEGNIDQLQHGGERFVALHRPLAGATPGELAPAGDR